MDDWVKKKMNVIEFNFIKEIISICDANYRGDEKLRIVYRKRIFFLWALLLRIICNM